MSPVLESMLRSAAFLGVFTLVGTFLIDWTYDQTRQRIVENERIALLQSLNELIPASWYDNDILSDTLAMGAGTLPKTIYRIRKQQKNLAVVISTQTADGYNGTIKLLVAIKENGGLIGVRVISHQETPGLGDGIEVRRSHWIQQFAGLSLNNPNENAWTVKRDGGAFDQFTGATITPRAVVNTVRRTLIFYRNNRIGIFK